MKDKDRQAEDAFRRLQNEVRRRDSSEKPEQHWYESYAPSVEPVAANFRGLHTANLQTILMPIHLHKAMAVRVLSMYVRDSGGAANVFAFAIYKAVLPKSTLSRKQQAERPPAGGVFGGTYARFQLELVDTIGRAAFSIISIQHVVAQKDINVDPDEDDLFLGIMAATSASAQIFAPALTTGGPHCAYRATEPATVLGRLPAKTSTSLDRLTPPHFWLRSAKGARLYQDPLIG